MKQTVLITGCSSGMGKASAKHFAAEGWNVIATMREPAAGADLAQLDGVLVTRLDVQDPASISAAIEAGIAHFGRIDALVNNAGFGLHGIFEATSRDKIQEQFDVNVFGVMDVVRAILPHFRHNRKGTIVNVSSGAGVFTLPMISLYAASKFALEGFSEALSYELAAVGVTVKIVEPGGVSTNFNSRASSEAGQQEALIDYQPFIEATNQIYASWGDRGSATAEEVAAVIYGATTDGSDQLRYVATGDILPLVQARRETSELQYMNFMRAQFQFDLCSGCTSEEGSAS